MVVFKSIIVIDLYHIKMDEVKLAGKRIVLTADRSLMTNYRGNFLYGFIACGPYDEREEIKEIYKAKGFSGKDLEMIVNKITSDKKVWLNTMLSEELNLNLEIVGHPLKSALRMFGSFLLGGILPIIPFFFAQGLAPLLIAIGISVSTSFVVGAIKSRMANISIVRGGLEMAGLGTGIALIGFGIGSELANLGIINV